MTEYISPNQIFNNLANLPQLVFEVTDSCNLKCKYCAYGEFYDDFDKRENKMMSTSSAIRLIEYLNQYWNSERNTSAKSFIYISFYGGEPLLNFNFIHDIVYYVENKLHCPRRKFLFSMTTNAILLHKYMDFLVVHDFHILVSLDGNKINDSYRVDHNGKNSFDRVIRNVDLLREKYPKFFDKNINFNSVLHNRNSVEDIYSFFKTKYSKKPTISELNNSGIKADKIQKFNHTYRNSEESLHQSEHYEEIEKDLFIDSSSYKSLLLYLHQYSGFFFRDYTDLLCDRSHLEYIPTGTCLPFGKKMFVTVNGKILPCERIGHQYGLGYLTATGIELDIVEIARKYNEYYTKMENQCNHCKNKYSCIQCLFNIKNIEKKPICYGFMNEAMLQQFALKQYQFLRDHPDAYYKIMKKSLII